MGGQPETWAILCGKIRDEAACLRKLATLAAWRREGLIDGIVCATWIDELPAYPSIAAALDDLGALIVEIAEPALRLPGHVLHQMTAIHYALLLVPPDARVLRLRPDLIDLSPTMADFLRAPPDLTPAPPPGWPMIVRERIVILEGFALSPFYINDMTFFGRARDVARLLGMDLRAEVLFSHHAPEQWFFAQPFLPHLPILESYFPVASGLRFQEAAWSRRFIDLHLAESFYRQVFLTYMQCLSSFFTIGFDRQDLRLDRSIRLLDAMRGAVPCPGLAFRSNLSLPIIQHRAVVDAILDGGFAPDDLTGALADEVAAVRDWSVQSGWSGNPLRPPASVQRFCNEVTIPLGSGAPRIDTAADPDHRHFRIEHAGDRWQVLTPSDETRALQEENNHLRRLIDRARATP